MVEVDIIPMKNIAMIVALAATCAWVPAASVTASAKEAAANDEATTDDDKIRCRKIEVTGSLARKTKVCKTVAEWRAMSDKGNRNARDIIESGNVCSGGPMCNGG